MNLKLKRPIAFIDLETTGVDIAKDRIVEISILKVQPNGNKESKTLRINPEIPISEESTAVHGISNEDIKDAPTFKEVAKNLEKFLEGCDLGGFNSIKFDIPLLTEEFLRTDIDFDIRKRKHIDIQNIFHKMEKRTLEAAYQFYCNKSIENAHSAEADIMATYEVLEAQIAKYDELSADADFLAAFSKRDNNVDNAGRFVYDEEQQININFGKYKGQNLKEVLKRDPGYYAWMMKSDFPLHTKKILSEVRLSMTEN